MFAVARDRGLRFSHCTNRLGGFDCIYVFTTPGESPDAVLRVEGGASAGYRVTSVFVLEQQRISDPARAARLLIDAWAAGDRQRALRLARPAVVDALFQAPRRPMPSFAGCPYRAFGFDCTYAYRGGGALVLRVEGGASVGYGVAAVRLPNT
jgi:hypothetical protein